MKDKKYTAHDFELDVIYLYGTCGYLIDNIRDAFEEGLDHCRFDDEELKDLEQLGSFLRSLDCELQKIPNIYDIVVSHKYWGR